MSPPPFVLNSALSDMSENWLRLTCCRGTTHVPIWQLAENTRPKARLRQVLPRLRCAVCNDVPRSSALVQSPANGTGAERPHGWVIELT
jgi:hypothetical protein